MNEDMILDLKSIYENSTYKHIKQAVEDLINELEKNNGEYPKILRDEYYRCRLCERKCHKEYNSYIIKLSRKIHIRVCRHCWLRVTKFIGLLNKVQNKNITLGGK